MFSSWSQTLSHWLGHNRIVTAIRHLPLELATPRVHEGAPLLRDVVPRLAALKLELVEQDGVASRRHTRIVLVDQAPASFIVSCGDERCRHGGYDLTGDVLPRLQRGRAEWKVTRVCNGRIGTSSCRRRAQCFVHAEYRAL